MEVGFPHVRTVIHIRRRTEAKAETWEEAYYLSSHESDKYTPEQWLQLIRNHWAGCEIRNHWRKDAILFEDKTRSRNENIAGNLAVMRNSVLLFYIERRAHYPVLSAFIESVSAKPSFAYRLVCKRI